MSTDDKHRTNIKYISPYERAIRVKFQSLPVPAFLDGMKIVKGLKNWKILFMYVTARCWSWSYCDSWRRSSCFFIEFCICSVVRGSGTTNQANKTYAVCIAAARKKTERTWPVVLRSKPPMAGPSANPIKIKPKFREKNRELVLKMKLCTIRNVPLTEFSLSWYPR